MSWIGSLIDAAHDSRMERSRRRQDAINQRDAEAAQWYMWHNSLTNIVNQAKANKIHPLAALGANTYTPTVSVGSSGAAYRSNPGAIVDNLIRGKIEREQHEQSKKESESRIALNIARASEVARRAQDSNSRQDSVIVSGQGDVIPVAYPGESEKAQQSWGEFGEFVVGAHNFTRDTYLSAKKRYEKLKKIHGREGVKLSPYARAMRDYGFENFSKMEPKRKKYIVDWYRRNK